MLNNETPPTPQRGNLLLSEPFMWDPNFRRSVLLLCECNEEGAFGLILNRPLALEMADVVDNWFVEVPLYYGGPVGQDRLLFLHKYGNLIPDSVEISPGIYCGGDFEVVKDLIHSREISTDNIRFYIGYSGWDEDQLIEETASSSWIILPSNSSYVFSGKGKQLWRDVLSDMGGEYRILANCPENPQMN
jgi:putative transcriptional regulator